jgi:adenylate cyclase
VRGPHESTTAKKHIRTVGFVTAAAAVVATLWSLVNLIDGRMAIGTQNMFLASGFFAAFFLNRAGRPTSAATLTALIFLLQMAFATYAFGYSSGTHLFFLLGTVIPYLMFRRADILRAHLFAVISAVGFIASIVWQNELPVRYVIVSVPFMEIFNSFLVLIVLLSVAIFFVITVSRGEVALEAAHDRANELLLNVLPESIAERLKAEPGKVIADRHDNVTVMFVDIVGFTAIAEAQSPEDTVAMLNKLFTEFDKICERFGVEKVRTIGDGYMVIAGAPIETPDHQTKVVEAGLAFLELAKDQGLGIRIGINCGELVSGIVGLRRFQYDVWGDTVNVAARMETTGEPGKIHVSGAMIPYLENHYVCTSRGNIQIKGKGEMKTWFVESPSPHVANGHRKSI